MLKARQAHTLETRDGPQVAGMYDGNPVVAVAIALV